MDYAALAVLALLVAASACWPLLRASSKRRKALKAQALQLPEHHRPRYRQSLAGDPLAFPLAMSSGYALCRGADLDAFLFPDPEEERIILAEAWGIFDDEDALQEIWSLLSHGHRSVWQQARDLVETGGTPLAQHRNALGKQARTSDEAREQLLSLRRLQRNERGVLELDFLAWDLSRAVMVARSAATCGYLDLRIAQDVALQAASYAQQTYGSWDEFVNAFDTARWFWRAQQDNALDDAHDAHRTEVLTGADGPFAQVDFAAPIPDSQLLLLEAAEQLGLPLRALEEDRDWQRALVAAARSRT
ncbi:DUF1266 domain-containing protein [Glutamicibacter sp. NPDC087583]|uniref:DUF1266 domain-containing protein n=1 Tax=Glutamicibacter sp. NPDC087583 TaxID=3363995 RepID=UPI00383066E7